MTPSYDLVPLAQRDRDAEMRDAVEEIHRAIDGIDDPLEGAGLVAGDAFLAIDGVIREVLQEQAGDELLRSGHRAPA